METYSLLELLQDECIMMRDIHFYDLLAAHYYKTLTDYQLMQLSEKIVKFILLDAEKLKTHYKDKKIPFITTIYIPTRLTEQQENMLRNERNWRKCIGKRPTPPIVDINRAEKLLTLKAAMKANQSVKIVRKKLSALNDLVEELYFCQDFEWRIGAAERVFPTRSEWKSPPRSRWTIFRQKVQAVFYQFCWPCVTICEEYYEEEHELEQTDEDEMTYEAKCDLAKYIF